MQEKIQFKKYLDRILWKVCHKAALTQSDVSIHSGLLKSDLACSYDSILGPSGITQVGSYLMKEGVSLPQAFPLQITGYVAKDSFDGIDGHHSFICGKVTQGNVPEDHTKNCGYSLVSYDEAFERGFKSYWESIQYQSGQDFEEFKTLEVQTYLIKSPPQVPKPGIWKVCFKSDQ